MYTQATDLNPKPDPTLILKPPELIAIQSIVFFLPALHSSHGAQLPHSFDYHFESLPAPKSWEFSRA